LRRAEKSTMKVLHVDTAREWRGGQQQLAHLLASRADDLWAGAPDGEFARRVRPPDVALYAGNDPRNAWIVRRAAAATRADLIAAQTSHGHNASLLAGIPFVVHRRNHRRPTNIWKYRPAACTIADSAFVADLCRSSGVERVEIVYDGVAQPADGPEWVHPGGVLVVAVGALAEHKGHAELLAALAELPETVHLWIAGEGPMRAQLADLGRPLGARVRLLGQVEGVGNLLRTADVFVHPSSGEALGGAVIEAGLCGCRMVCRNTGGIREGAASNAELVGEGAPALARGVLTALARPKPAAPDPRLAAFSVAEMVRRTTAIYESATERARR
jgi:glycosyltransferase involved in cell wall biosynthesis